MAEEKAKRKGRMGSFDETHERILRYALEIFSRKGFRGATTREIAAAAGVTEVTLFRHFPTKEAVFEGVGARFSLINVLEKVPPGFQALPTKDKFRFVAQKFFEIMMERLDLVRLSMMESLTNPDHAAMFFEKIPSRVIGMVAKIFEAEIVAGKIKKLDPKLLARQFLGGFMSYIFIQEIMGGGRHDKFKVNEVVNTYLTVFLDGAETGE